MSIKYIYSFLAGIFIVNSININANAAYSTNVGSSPYIAGYLKKADNSKFSIDIGAYVEIPYKVKEVKSLETVDTVSGIINTIQPLGMTIDRKIKSFGGLQVAIRSRSGYTLGVSWSRFKCINNGTMVAIDGTLGSEIHPSISSINKENVFSAVVGKEFCLHSAQSFQCGVQPFVGVARISSEVGPYIGKGENEKEFGYAQKDTTPKSENAFGGNRAFDGFNVSIPINQFAFRIGGQAFIRYNASNVGFALKLGAIASYEKPMAVPYGVIFTIPAVTNDLYMAFRNTNNLRKIVVRPTFSLVVVVAV